MSLLEQFVLLLSETRIENWIRQRRKKLSTLKWPLPHWLVYQTIWKVSNHIWILQLILKTCILPLAICVRWNLNFFIIGKWVYLSWITGRFYALQKGFTLYKAEDDLPVLLELMSLLSHTVSFILFDKLMPFSTTLFSIYLLAECLFVG